MLRPGFLGLAFALMWVTADAQPVASSLAELKGLATAESKVTVIDTKGQEFRIGALAGLGIDALIHGTVIAYTAPRPSAQHLFTVTPMIARGRRGVWLTIAF